jgi:hypothetical protein
MGYTPQGSIQTERPTVIIALERAIIAALFPAERGSAVSASIAQDTHNPVSATHHDDWLQTNEPGHPISGLRQLGFVSHKNPSAPEDSIHLVGKDFLVRVQAPVDTVVANERGIICNQSRLLPLKYPSLILGYHDRRLEQLKRLPFDSTGLSTAHPPSQGLPGAPK